MLMGDSEMQWICSSILTLYGGQHWGLIFAMLYFIFHILISCHFILSACNNLSSMVTYFITSPKISHKLFTPHLLNHFIMSSAQPDERIMLFLIFWYYASYVLSLFGQSMIKHILDFCAILLRFLHG